MAAAIQNNATRTRSRLQLTCGDMPGPIAIVIADDHAALRESLAALPQSHLDFEVGWEAYLPAPAAIFLTIAITSLRSLSFKLGE